jgi:hypothetical protein
MTPSSGVGLAGEDLATDRGHARSIRRNPPVGVHHSTTSIVAASSRWVCTTSAMSAWKRSPCTPSLVGAAAIARPEIFASPGQCASEPSTGSTVALCRAKRGSRRRSAPLRAFGIEPKTSSPSSKTASIPEIRGDPSARKVAIVLCLWASNNARTRCANSGSARSTSSHAVMHPCSHR